eukprot:g11170.t1
MGGNKKKKAAGPPPVFATSSVKSRKNVEDEEKAQREKEEAAAAEAEKERLEAEEERQREEAEKNGTQLPPAAEAAAGDKLLSAATAAETATAAAAIYRQREAEELQKLSLLLGSNASLKRVSLKPAGAVALSAELEDSLFRFALGDRSRTEVLPSEQQKQTPQLRLPDAYRLKKVTYEKLSVVYSELEELGFSPDQIVRGMRETFGYDHRAAVEYLTLFSDFRLQVQSQVAGGETVEDSFEGPWLPPSLQSEAERDAFFAFERRRKQLEAEERERAEKQAKAERAAAARERKRQREREKRAVAAAAAEELDNKNWILQQAQEEEMDPEVDGQDDENQAGSSTTPRDDVERDEEIEVDETEMAQEGNGGNDAEDAEEPCLPDLFGEDSVGLAVTQPPVIPVESDQSGLGASVAGHEVGQSPEPLNPTTVTTGAAAEVPPVLAPTYAPSARNLPKRTKQPPAKKPPVLEGLNIHASWTGKLPSQILDNFVVKALGKSFFTKKSCDKTGVGRLQVTVSGGKEAVFDFEVPYRCKTRKDAIELVSTYALYMLQKQLNTATTSIHELLPPGFRAFYLGLARKDEEKRLEERRLAVKVRVKLCLELSGELSKEAIEGLEGKSSVKVVDRGQDPEPLKMLKTPDAEVVDLVPKDFSVGSLALSCPTTKTRAAEVEKAPEAADASDGGPAEVPFTTRTSAAADQDNNPTTSKQQKFDRELAEAYVENYERRHALQAQRNDLPVAEFKNEVIRLVEDHRVSVVSGSTGSGKTTQVPQYVLEHALLEHYNINSEVSAKMDDEDKKQQLPMIIVTEPRRISAISVAQRVASEMGEREPGAGLVGYQIRLEKKAHPVKCRLLFCTIGVLLQKLKNDPLLKNVSHVFVDEVHERSAESDLALLLLKRQLPYNPKLRLCLMSATADSGKLLGYFKGLRMQVRKPFDQNQGKKVEAIEVNDKEEHDQEQEKQDTRKAPAALDEWEQDDEEDEAKEASPRLEAGEADGRRLLTRQKWINPEQRDDGNEEQNRELLKLGYLEVPGRIFPVEEFFLEDVLEATNDVREDVDESASFYNYDDNFQSAAGGATTSISGGSAQQATAATLAARGFSRKTIDALTWKLDQFSINYSLIEALLVHIEQTASPAEQIQPHEGAILIFLPGLPEISRLQNQLQSSERLNTDDDYVLVPLHSQILTEQKTAFGPAPRGKRKVVLSTNIAETGVTIPDVVFVIDTGKVKQNSYHEASNSSSLKEVFVSRAEATQRKGRAGRVRSGFCYRLYTKFRFDEKFAAAPVPELLRTSLVEPMLSVLVSGFQPTLFKEALDVPPDARIQQALMLLYDVGCVVCTAGGKPVNLTAAGVSNYLQQMTVVLSKGAQNNTSGDPTSKQQILVKSQENDTQLQFTITALGRELAKLPLDIRLGKMLVLGKIFGGSEYLLNAVAALSVASSTKVFLDFLDDARKQAARQKQGFFFERLRGKWGGVVVSDHLALAEMLKEFEEITQCGAAEKNNRCTGRELRNAQDRFARGYFLNKSALLQMLDVKQDLREKLEKGSSSSARAGGEDQHHNSNSCTSAEVVLVKQERKDRPVLAACLVAAGLRPNLARVDVNTNYSSQTNNQNNRNNWRVILSAGNETNMRLHPTSSHISNSLLESLEGCRWLAYHAKVKTTGSYLRDATLILNPLWVVLFHQGEEFDIFPNAKAIVFNGHRSQTGGGSSNSSDFRDWQCVSMAPSTAVALRQVKIEFQLVFKKFVENGGCTLNERERKLVGLVKKMVESRP